MLFMHANIDKTHRMTYNLLDAFNQSFFQVIKKRLYMYYYIVILLIVSNCNTHAYHQCTIISHKLPQIER